MLILKPKKPRIYVPLEAQEQIMYMQWANIRKIPVVHIANERRCSAHEGAKLKRMGVSPGFPDLFLPMARKSYHGLFIEMKRKCKFKVTQEQTKWLNLLTEQGYLAVVCAGFEQAKDVTTEYLREN